MTDDIIAKFSAEQTANFLGGGELGRPKYTDPELQKKMDLQRERLRKALLQSVTLFSNSLQGLSSSTQTRLMELAEGAFRGDSESMRLFMAMYGELCAQALRP